MQHFFTDEACFENPYNGLPQECVLGLPKLDDDHAVIFDLASKLGKLAADKAPMEDCAVVLGELHSTLQSHFKAEENLYVLSRWGLAVSHKGYHDDFLKELLDLHVEHDNQDYAHLVIAATFSKKVHQWLRAHILYEDALYTQWLKSSLRNYTV